MWLDKLISIKKESGKTTQQISDESGIPIGTLNKLFSRKTEDPKLSTVRAVVHCLGYTLDDIDDFQSQKYLTPQETEIALAYRKASANDRMIVELTLKKYMEEEVDPPDEQGGIA